MFASSPPRSALRRVVLCLTSGLLVFGGCQSPVETPTVTLTPHDLRERVGRTGPNRFVTPANQILTPAGRQIDLPGLRPQVIALSPDGRLLITSGKTAELIVLAPATGTIRERVKLPSERDVDPAPDAVSSQILQPDAEGQVSFTGLVFAPDGRHLYLANVNGSIKVFEVRVDGTIVALRTLPLPPANAPGRKAEIPSGLAVSSDGQRLLVVLNLSNQLGEMDLATGQMLRTWPVGVAPYDVVISGRKAYVSNWGGRRPEAGQLTGPAGRGTTVRVDPVRHIANEGSVTVVDLHSGTVTGEILTGLHASGLAVSPNGRHVVVANAASDTLSVIDTRTDTVVETIWARANPADLFSASPNALTFDHSGNTLFVCNGTQNAVAVVKFDPGESKVQGLIPTAWYPGAIAYDRRRRTVHVANIKGIGSTRQLAPGEAPKFKSGQYYGTVSSIPVPSARELPAHTATVLHNYHAPRLKAAALPPRPGQPARPVPERVGEPSVFRHVIYIIKENRTYDQVLGDLPEGNGDPSLCIFGETITPNQHRLVRDFVLLDNTYCSGILSADGHQWAATGITTDYLEKSFAGFPRSYPDGMDDTDVDAIAYSPAGFIWDNALAHGKTYRNYGEFAITDKSWKDPNRKGKITFLDHYREFINGTRTINLSSRPAVESMWPHLNTNTVGWDMDVPDVFRAAEFIRELREFERTGNLPNLLVICLPNDHTSGLSAGSATPAAAVADNDLAFGQIVEAVSRSRFWKETCILAIEDDPQAGWDHVSGYRTTAYVVSPYSRRRGVISTQYNQTSLLRTMELILGLPAMHIMDASATPMSDCFGDTADLTPYTVIPSNIPLDQVNPDPKKVADKLLGRLGRQSSQLPLHAPDLCDEDTLNRILWHAMKGSSSPYPQWAVGVSDDD